MRALRYVCLLGLCAACGFRTIGRLESDPEITGGGGGVSGAEPGGAGGVSFVVGGGGSPSGGAGNAGSAGGAGNAGSAGSVGGMAGAQNADAGAGGEAGAGESAREPRALILVDQRLYTRLAERLDRYRVLAEARRGFAIRLRVEAGLDDRDFRKVKALLDGEVASHPQLEGVLFVGNVSVPAYYKVRADNLSTRLFPYFYEDLDATWLRAQDPGTTDPLCVDFTTEQNCNTVGNQVVPPHDIDRLQVGARLGPEFWSAYWPVGVSGSANDYATFAAQLSPYLDKLIAFYSRPTGSAAPSTNGHYYFVSNDPGWGTLKLLWDALPPDHIDLYGKAGPNGETGSGCYVNGENRCYVRWPLEKYDSFPAFKQAYELSPAVGEGWQDSQRFSAHMNAALNDFVSVNVPGNYDACLVDTARAKGLQQAGLVVALSCSSAVGFALPRSDNRVDLAALASDNVGVGFLYGASRTLAVLGDPTNRGHAANLPVLYAALKSLPDGYLGAAHLARMRWNYAEAGYEGCVAQGGLNCGYSLSENASEMLLGDPFLDLR